MGDQNKFDIFHSLHVAGRPLVLYNVWDAGSAVAVAASGARAIATGSWSVATANGFSDGENMPLDAMLEVVARIVRTVDLPVTADLESGYAADAAGVRRTLERALECGIVGCNLEDGVVGENRLRSAEDQAERCASARAAADAAGVRLFINARTDVFLFAAQDTPLDGSVDEVLRRARIYASAGASGLFVPWLADEKGIARLTAESPLPLNLMVGPSTPRLVRLAELGVSRVSHGAGPLRRMVRELAAAAKEALGPAF